MQIPLTRSLPAPSFSAATTQPSWWVENFRERSLNKQRLPVRMCHVHSQVHGWPFDPFTGNLFLHGWLCLGGRLCRVWGLDTWNGIFLKNWSTLLVSNKKVTENWGHKAFTLSIDTLSLSFWVSLSSLTLSLRFSPSYFHPPRKISPFDSDISQGQSCTYNLYEFNVMLKPVFMV